MSSLPSVSSWIRPPEHAWTIDEVKQGYIVTTYSLNNIIDAQRSRNSFPYITFGRVADDPSLVDIVTAHESCSRQHARIAFDSHGTPWLRDLGSANGTFVNEKPLPPEACGKKYEVNNSNQKGSRGVVLFPGDAIRLGASTRLYILEGPEEFERGASSMTRKRESKDSTSKRSKAAPSQCDGGTTSSSSSNVESSQDLCCGWGMVGDDVPSTDKEQRKVDATRDDDPPPLPSMDAFFTSASGKYLIPSNLHQLHSQYNTKMHRMQSIQNESQRIIQKENMGLELSDGQRNQVAKNQERISTLEIEVETLREKIEDGMFSAIHGKERGNKRSRDERHVHTEEDDVDYFYDRTASSSKKRQKETTPVESEASLINKWRSLLNKYTKQRLMVARSLERHKGLQQLIDEATKDDDDLFFMNNDLKLANETLSKANSSLRDIEKELDECEYLLKTVNNKLVWDREEGLIGANIVVKKDEPEANTAVSTCSMPPPPRVDTRLLPSRGEEGIASVRSPTIQSTKKTTCSTVQGTLDTIRQASAPPRSEAAVQPTIPAVLIHSERQVDEWQAPIGQDGSGRTALHDKFMGRY